MRSILIAALCLIATPALAQRFTGLTNQGLLAYCSASDARGEICSSYIDGIADAIAFQQRLRPADGSKGARLPDYTCIPTSVTGLALRQLVAGWIRQHPDKGRDQASGAVMDALHGAYPCR